MSNHACNQYCSNTDIHNVQKALGINDINELEKYLIKIIEMINNPYLP
mgnify:CR=1 FL=1